MKTIIAIVFLLSSVASSQTLYYSTGSGNFSTASNWSSGVSPCGSAGNAIFISVQTAMTLDCDLGTSGSGNGINTLRIERGGALYSYDGAHPGQFGTAAFSRHIYFNSTGTDAIGSGTGLNPGSDATSMGIFDSYGTFRWQGSAAATLTVAPANRSSPIWVHHAFDDYSGCTAITTAGCTGGAQQYTHGAVFTCYYCILQHAGVSGIASTFEGLAFNIRPAETNPTSSFDIENTELDYPYEFTCASCNGLGTWTLSNVWLNSPTGNNFLYFLTPNGSILNLTNITETGATTTGQTFNFIYRPQILVFTGNVTIGSAAVQRGMLGIVGAGAPANPAWTIQNNFLANPEALTSLTSTGFYIYFVANDTTSTINGNVCWGGYNCYYVLNPSGSSSGPSISQNWGAQYKESYAAGDQGILESPGHYFSISHNIFIVENASMPATAMGTLTYTGFGSGSVYHLDNNTYFWASGTGIQDHCVNLGDTGGMQSAIAAPSWVRSNLLNGCYTGIVDNVNDTFSTSQCDSAGVCNNLIHATTVDYCVVLGGCSASSHGGSGWDDGTNYHPNSLYGDLSDSIDPNFTDPTRRPTHYDSYCGGPGTLADLGTQFSYRIGGQLGAYNSCFNVASMLAWLQAGFAPRNFNLQNAGFGGTYVGAMPPHKVVWKVGPPSR